jgi:hypothetical protein
MTDQPLRSRSSEPAETSALSGGGAAPLMMKAGVGSVRKFVLNARSLPQSCAQAARANSVAAWVSATKTVLSNQAPSSLRVVATCCELYVSAKIDEPEGAISL